MKNNHLGYKLYVYLFFSIVFILGVTYLTWRFSYTLNTLTTPFTTFWSYSLCLAEILTLLVFTNFGLILLKAPNHRKIVVDNKLQQDYTTDYYKNGELITFKNFCPSVDIFICTLNEPMDLLSTTIAACKNINYPNKNVYVLDDGKRPDIEELTKMLGCNYITRATNKGFKAGNINNALKITDSEIIVIFDADHIPASTFLKETVYFFSDENVALVQTPQHFCNPDAFQKNMELPEFLANEQEMFYRIIEPGLSKFDSVFCGGTNILVRRRHLDSVGDFPETTITEDSLLGLEFHAKGYKTIYYNRPIAIGLAASSFEEYIKQRARWAKGNIQIFKNPANWHLYREIKPIQAFFYLSCFLYFLTPISRIIYLLAPVLFLFFDITPVLAFFYQIIAFQISYFGLKFMFIFSSKINTRNIIFADVYDLITSIFTIKEIITTLLVPQKFANIKFNVTNKNTSQNVTNKKYLFTLWIIMIVVVCAEMQGIYDLLFSDVYSTLAIVANLFWNTTNIIVLVFGIKAASEKPEKRKYQRIKVGEKIIIEDSKHNKYKTEIADASRSGLQFVSEQNLPEDKNEDLTVKIEGEENQINMINCSIQKGKQICKSIFRKPIVLIKLTKRNLQRLEKFVKLAYKNPELWDDFFSKIKK